MRNLFHELRRRHVFRAIGLYVGVAWIVLQGADLLLPAFETPDWVFRTLVIMAFVGLPLTGVLAWIYEYTERGFERQELVESENLPRTHGRQMDFIVIGVLLIALSFSVYLNLREEAVSPEAMDPVSILIADFDDDTGNPEFEGLLELALEVALEGAPFVTAFDRYRAINMAAELHKSAAALDVEIARSVAVQEGIKYVVAGTVYPKGASYAMQIVVLDPADGKVVTEASSYAMDESEVFNAVGSLAGQLREALGDEAVHSSELPESEIFSATSIEAASLYAKARLLSRNGSLDQAIELYKRAIEADTNFGRALAGYALLLFQIGRTEEAEATWRKAEFALDTMTERERLRNLAIYYILAAQNFKRAQDIYEQLAELYPADSVAQNNLAIAYFADFNYSMAQKKGARLVEIYPKNVEYRRDLALYAMYAGDFDTAAAEAQTVLEQAPASYLAYLPLAIAALANGDDEVAIEHYRNMARADVSGASLSTEGFADIAIYTGKFEEAKALLKSGVDRDLEAGVTRGVARKSIALASVLTMEGSFDSAVQAINEALRLSRNERILFPAAHLLIELGRSDVAADLAEELNGKLQPYPRAYGKLIEGILVSAEGDAATGVEVVKQSIAFTDLWLARFHLGIIFLEAGYPAEALSQFGICETRVAEASALFLDDMPTWRYTAPLMYWKARANDAINMRTPAIEGYQRFLALRPEPTSDPLVADTRKRLADLGFHRN